MPKERSSHYIHEVQATGARIRIAGRRLLHGLKEQAAILIDGEAAQAVTPPRDFSALPELSPQELAQFETKTPQEIVEQYFYTPYVEERTTFCAEVKKDFGIDVNLKPEAASLASLWAAGRAGYSFALKTPYKAYLCEFRLPEQYVGKSNNNRVHSATEAKTPLNPATRSLAAEIVQAWALVDLHAQLPDKLKRRYQIEHPSLLHTAGSFSTTYVDTDLTLVDLGLPSNDQSLKESIAAAPFLMQTAIGTLRPETREAITRSFMQRVKMW